MRVRVRVKVRLRVRVRVREREREREAAQLDGLQHGASWLTRRSTSWMCQGRR